MKRYEIYKSSGIEWINTIPKDWIVMRVKDLFYVINGSTPNSGNEILWDGDITWITPADMVDFGPISEGKRCITKEGYLSCGTSILPVGSIILSSRAPIGKVNWSTRKLCTNQGCKSLVNRKQGNLYFYYLLFTLREILTSFGRGTTFMELGTNDLKNIKLLVPPCQTQSTIANYLDTKTAAIDRKIELHTTKADKYKALRRSLINETVCRGLNPDAALKDSGIEWIGKIPEHWEVKRVKELFDISRGRVIGQQELIDDGKYPVYSSQTENNGCLGYINTYDFNATLLTWTTDGANAGTVFKRTGKFNCTNVCGLLKSKRQNHNLDFMLYVLQISASHNKRIDTNGAKIMSNEMSIIPLLFPPIKEQVTIATYLDSKTAQFDTILTNIGEQINKLTQLRKTLINDVVTGKIKVTE